MDFAFGWTKVRGINESDEVKMSCGVDIISRALFPYNLDRDIQNSVLIFVIEFIVNGRT